jgi:hypothetical protein
MGEDDEEHLTAGWALMSAPDRDADMLERAIGHFEAALALDPDDAQATANVLSTLFAVGRESEAVARARGCAVVSRSELARRTGSAGTT